MPGPVVQLKEQDGNPSGLTPPSGEAAIWGDSQSAYGVYGSSGGSVDVSIGLTGVGVFGQNNTSGYGVVGYSESGIGVYAHCNTGVGVEAVSEHGIGVVGQSKQDAFAGVQGLGARNGVYGVTSSPADSGVFGQNTGTGFGVSGTCANGTGIYGQGGQNAGLFDGNVTVNGTITVSGDVVLTGGADCAEEFDVVEAADIEPGTVMVLDQDGALHQSQQAYDKRVAGVISGAGDYKPGLILDRRQSQDYRVPVALVGKVYCKVDAQYAPIEVGDLLTTSSTPGHAMKADDPFKAFGSVIGKALRPLKAGREMIPILIALQ